MPILNRVKLLLRFRELQNSLPWRGISSQPFCTIRSHHKNREIFLKMLAVAECYLIKNHVKKQIMQEAAVSKDFSCKLADGSIPMEKENISLYLIYSIVSLGMMAGKPFSQR